MDLFDLEKIISYGHSESGTFQCILLFMIWFNSRGIKKEIVNLSSLFNAHKAEDESRFQKLENRVILLEPKGVKNATSTIAGQ